MVDNVAFSRARLALEAWQIEQGMQISRHFYWDAVANKFVHEQEEEFSSYVAAARIDVDGAGGDGAGGKKISRSIELKDATSMKMREIVKEADEAEANKAANRDAHRAEVGAKIFSTYSGVIRGGWGTGNSGDSAALTSSRILPSLSSLQPSAETRQRFSKWLGDLGNAPAVGPFGDDLPLPDTSSLSATEEPYGYGSEEEESEGERDADGSAGDVQVSAEKTSYAGVDTAPGAYVASHQRADKFFEDQIKAKSSSAREATAESLEAKTEDVSNPITDNDPSGDFHAYHENVLSEHDSSLVTDVSALPVYNYKYRFYNANAAHNSDSIAMYDGLSNVAYPSAYSAWWGPVTYPSAYSAWWGPVAAIGNTNAAATAM